MQLKTGFCKIVQSQSAAISMRKRFLCISELADQVLTDSKSYSLGRTALGNLRKFIHGILEYTQLAVIFGNRLTDLRNF